MTRTAGAFLTTYARFGPYAGIPRHFHDRPIVAVTLTGEWTSTLGRTHFELGPANLHTEPAGDVHSNRFGAQGAEVVIVQPDPEARDLLAPCADVLTEAVHVRTGSAYRCARELARELTNPDAFSGLAIESVSLELLATLGRSRRTPADAGGWVRQTEAYMRANFLSELTSVDLVRVAGVHPSHLGREFKRRYGRSPAAYLRALRLQWAAEQIHRTEGPLSEIALAAGFADQSHFTRAFTRFAGRSPAAYRRGARQLPTAS